MATFCNHSSPRAGKPIYLVRHAAGCQGLGPAFFNIFVTVSHFGAHTHNHPLSGLMCSGDLCILCPFTACWAIPNVLMQSCLRMVSQHHIHLQTHAVSRSLHLLYHIVGCIWVRCANGAQHLFCVSFCRRDKLSCSGLQ